MIRHLLESWFIAGRRRATRTAGGDPNLARQAFIAAPIVSLMATAVLLGHPRTREAARPWLLFENGPVELLTFAFLMLGGISGLVLAARLRRLGAGALTVGFYAVYSVGLLIVAMEEIAWGQWFFHWRTPDEWAAINVRRETTLHNHRALNPVLPVLHLLFGVGGLAGVMAARIPALSWVAAPRVLAPWFLIIAAHAALELVSKLWRGSLFHLAFERTSEVMEMYLAIAAWLFVFLNARRFRDAEPRPGAS